MRQLLSLSAALALGSFALASCGDEPTQPNTAGEPSPTAPEFAIVHNSWVKRADMWSVERYNFATATVTNAAGQSILYAIGGPSAGGTLSKVMAYNVATNTWTLRASLPVPLWGTNGAAVVAGKIYVSGGISEGNLSQSHFTPSVWLFMYDPATNRWTRKHDMPAAGDLGVTGVINNKLYVLTKCSGCVPDRFYRYNPVTDRWITLPKTAVSHTTPVGGVLYGKFYVTGYDGFTTSGRPNSTEVYDPATNQWTKAAPPPGPPLAWAAGAVQGGKLYVMGGTFTEEDCLEGCRDTLRTTSVYHPLSDIWTTGTPMPTARAGLAASLVFLNGKPRIEVVGGARPGNNLQYIP